MGIFEALELDSDNQRAKELRTASIKASRHAERMFGEFLASGDREVRLAYVEGNVRELTERYADYEGVDHGMLHSVVMQHLAEFGLPVEESKPKRINIETPIGAESENTKYKPEETPLDITRTDILDHDAVEEPETTRVEMDAEGVTQKDSSEKTAMPVSKKDFNAIAEILRARGADPSLVNDIANYFATQNPRFDRGRFDEATRPPAQPNLHEEGLTSKTAAGYGTDPRVQAILDRIIELVGEQDFEGAAEAATELRMMKRDVAPQGEPNFDDFAADLGESFGFGR